MPNRAERRAAERESHRATDQQLREHPRQQPPTPSIPDTQPSAISEIQFAATRANALLSTGPVTPEGKATSAQNALKYALTGVTVLLPGDDAAEYERHFNSACHSLKPATDEEVRLIQSMVDCLWRICRIKRLETGILLKGQLEFANKFPDHSPAHRDSLINVEAYLKYEKSIHNLHLQEARLHRRYEKDQLELTRIQTDRRRLERLAQEQNGFEFSTSSTSHQRSNGAATKGSDQPTGSAPMQETVLQPADVSHHSASGSLL